MRMSYIKYTGVSTIQQIHGMKNLYVVKGVLHLLPQKAPKLACFVLCLKIINIFLKNDICML